MRLPRIAATALLVILAGPALAHTGVEPHAHGFALGFAHPLQGADHLLAMIAVGLWAGLVGGAARILWPLAFVAAMMAAALAGASGLALPGAEAGIALSVFVLGGAVAMGARPPLAVGAALCAGLAVFHGYQHGAEMPADVAGAAYGLGFAMATATLLAGGVALSALLVRTAPWLTLRLSGAAIAAAGAALLVG